MARYRSFAKLNLFLDITGVQGGLHTLNMVMQSVSLYDELTFEPLLEDRVEVICDDAALQSNNIIEKAYRQTQLVFPQIRHGFRVNLKKNIPMGAGLAGGSGNAATAVHYLLKDHNIKPRQNVLRQLLLSIGSDVGFCYHGGTKHVRGVGELLAPLKAPYGHFLIVNPGVAINTADAYRLWDAFTPTACKTGGTPHQEDVSVPFNAFETVIFPLYPEIERLKFKLLGLGAKVALMSGSGSTVFGVFNTKNECEIAAKHFKKKEYKTWISRSILMGFSRLKNDEYSD